MSADELLNHLLLEQVFSKDVTAVVREVEGTHRLIVQWELIHPACLEKICVQFPSGGISEHCLSSTLTTEASISGIRCNQNVQVRVQASGSGVARYSSTLSVYIGGNML